MNSSLRVLICVISVLLCASCSPPKETTEAGEQPTSRSQNDKAEKPAKAIADPLAAFEDVSGLPKIPKKTGNFETDKAALIRSLTALQAAWDMNKKAQQVLEVDQGAKRDSPKLKQIRRANEAYQAYADKLQDLLEELEG